MAAWITPAGAGKTRVQCNAAKNLKDHPRRCGENIICLFCFIAIPGSPPQVRGKQFLYPVILTKAGITPAGAGKTVPPVIKSRHNKDHPRRCGENVFIGQTLPLQLGSPPQVRGKQRLKRVRSLIFRITPAGAGKTYCVDFGQVVNQDHPRRCGENRKRKSELNTIIGSPPQVRGKLAVNNVFAD